MLSFELGLLWPGFMGTFGSVIGLPFTMEGFAFFTEAIFLGIYLYGWNRLSAKAHFWAGVPVAVAGAASGFFVVLANAWMNQPTGFELDGAGRVTERRSSGGDLQRRHAVRGPHLILAAYMVTGFLVASVYAVGMLRGRRDRYHRLGFLIPFTVAAIATPIQLGVGDTAARAIAKDQPVKFAAMECVQKTSTDVTEYIGGICTSDGVKYGIGIPGLDSFLVGFSTDTEVIGLDSVPPEDRPPANTLLHLAFDTMVGIGSALLLLAAWLAFSWWRRRDLPKSKWFLRFSAIAGVGAIVALESGWIVTEVGRQPWVVYEHLRTEDAVTNAGGVPLLFGATVVLYTIVGVVTVLVLRLMARRWREEDQ